MHTATKLGNWKVFKRPITAEALESRRLMASIFVSDYGVTEGTSSTPSQAVFKVELFNGGLDPVTVRYTTVVGSAAAGVDFQPVAGTLTFNIGETVKNVVVPVVADSLQENFEIFSLRLSDPTDATLVRNTARCVIADDDASFVVVNDARVNEGTGGSTQMTFNVRRGGQLQSAVSVTYATTSRSAADPTAAQPGSDYQPVTGEVDFAPGETLKTVTVPIVGDALDESNESFNFTLTDPQNTTISTPNVVGIIRDDDDAVFFADSIQTIEGPPGNKTVPLTVRRVGQTAGPGSVRVTAQANGVITPLNTVVNFSAGEVAKNVDVSIIGDDVSEPDATVSVTLQPTGPAGSQSGAVGETRIVVLDDDGDALRTTLFIDDAAIVEGDSGRRDMVFTVTRGGFLDRTTEVDFATVQGTAQRDSDFVQTAGTLTFTPGQTTQTITVPIIGDLEYELTSGRPVGEFTVRLLNPDGATIVRDTGHGEIVDDDSAFPIVYAENTITSEGGDNGFFTLLLHRLGGENATTVATYATADGTATQTSGDYEPASGTVTFNPGETVKSIKTQAYSFFNTDLPVEYFSINTTPIDARDAQLGATPGRLYIADTNNSYIVFEPSAVVEGSQATVLVRRLGNLHATVPPNVGFIPLSAKPDLDFSSTIDHDAQTPAGASVIAYRVNTLADNLVEGDETFQLTFVEPFPDDASIFQPGTATVTIIDTPPTPPPAPPRVVQVFANQTAWGPAVRTYIGAHGLGDPAFGYAVPGGQDQLDSLPWTRFDQISVRFSRPVTIGQDALSVAIESGRQNLITDFHYDGTSHTATWTFAFPFRTDRLEFNVNADKVTSADGLKLDGEWIDSADNYASGDHIAGGDFTFGLEVLTADIDRSGGAVNAADLVQVRNRIGASAAGSGNGYSLFADLDGSGVIDAADLVLTRNRVGTSLPRHPGFDYPNFADSSGLTLFSATTVDGNVLRVAPAAERQNGAARRRDVQAITKGFSTSFDFRYTDIGGILDDSDNPGTDGIAFTVQAPGSPPPVLAGGGLSVWFDAYRNNSGPNDDVSSSRVGVYFNGVQIGQTDVEALGIRYREGGVHHAQINFDGSRLVIGLDNRPIATYDGIHLGDQGLVGFAGYSGEAYANQELFDWSFHTPPPTVVRAVMTPIFSQNRVETKQDDQHSPLV